MYTAMLAGEPEYGWTLTPHFSGVRRMAARARSCERGGGACGEYGDATPLPPQVNIQKREGGSEEGRRDAWVWGCAGRGVGFKLATGQDARHTEEKVVRTVCDTHSRVSLAPGTWSR